MWQIGKTDCSPEEAGYLPGYLGKLEGHFDKLMESGQVMASGYHLSRNGKTFAHRASGKLTFDKPDSQFRPDSLRRFASITKVFTAAAIMQLIEDGKLCISQSVSTIIPEFDTAQHRDIQIFHLLTHTSGLSADPGYFNDPYQRDIWVEMLRNPDWIKSVLKGPLQSRPGEYWSYCTAGFNILGEVIERASGMSYEDYIQSRIIHPLGLTDSHFQVPREKESRACLMDAWERQNILDKDTFQINKCLPGGGLVSTMADISRFGNMMLNQGTIDGVRILSRKSVEMMTRHQLHGVRAFAWGRNDPDFRAGLCFSYSGDKSLASPETYNHEGYGSSALYIDPAEKLVVVYISVNYGNWTAESVVAPRNIIWAGLV